MLRRVFLLVVLGGLCPAVAGEAVAPAGALHPGGHQSASENYFQRWIPLSDVADHGKGAERLTEKVE